MSIMNRFKKKKKQDISFKVKVLRSFTISITCVFLISIAVIFIISRNNWNYIYQQAKVLLEYSASQIEREIDTIEEITYKIITDKVVQESGSNLLEYGKGNSSYEKSSNLNNITKTIGDLIQKNHNIVSANYISMDGNEYIIASSKYVKLENEINQEITRAAREKNGSIAYLQFADLEEYKDYLIIARQIREQRKLSFNEIGIVYLLVDMKKISSFYVEEGKSGIIIEGMDDEIIFTYFDETIENLIIDKFKDNKDLYFSSFWKSGKDSYIIAKVKPESSQFSYAILSSASQLYNILIKGFKLLIISYIVIVFIVILISRFYARIVTSELACFVQYIREIPFQTIKLEDNNGTNTYMPHFEMEKGMCSEVTELKDAYDNMAERLNTLIKENYMQMLLVKEAQMFALQAQFNPHFLYNTLNSIYWMAKAENQKQIADMVSSLGILMREAIADECFVVPIEKELEILNNYIRIQKLRYENRLQIQIDIEQDCLTSAIPKFTLQPLLENAIYYGVEGMLEPCDIHIKVSNNEEKIICQVMNTGSEIDEDIMEKLRNKEIQPRGNGIGLLNIDNRIKSLFGEQYGISIKNDKGKGVTVQAILKQITFSEFML